MRAFINHKGAGAMRVCGVAVFVAARVKPHMRSDTICQQAASNVTYDPLCASDGQTFQNFLAFQCYVRFFNVRGLSVRRGACASRPEPNHCAFSFIVWRRVCSTENITYTSIWEMMCEGQMQGSPKYLMYEGPCRLRCPMSLRYDPVCGSDGVDYPNPEALNCASLMNSNITLEKHGPCSEVKMSQCRDMMSSRYGRETPVCGSNGVTYASHSAIMCLREHNPELRIQHDGPCRLEDINLTISPFRMCIYADNVANWLPVCASNGVTYPNPYVMQCAIERQQIAEDVKIDHAGVCAKDIPEGAGEPEDPCTEASAMTPIIDRPLFCASDGKTYYNAKQYACAVQRDGDWFRYSIVRLGFPCDASDNPCERLRLIPEALSTDPICGSDGVTYANPLALMCALSRDNDLRRHHKGPCLPSHAEEDHKTTTESTVTPGGGEELPESSKAPEAEAAEETAAAEDGTKETIENMDSETAQEAEPLFIPVI
ncbi:serine protease inhibitor dipetalogastin-like [Anabrus simplex]|uniref:serine protease inhibitor dipetalogastin-like n=1 Tax=Anabrus simplex TaxID=316456 RepID=UPI0035A30764